MMGTVRKKRGICLVMLVLWVGMTALPRDVSAAVIKAGAIKDAITRYVERNMPWPAGTVRLIFPRGVSDGETEGKTVKLEVQSRPEEDYLGDTAFRVNFYAGGEIVKMELVSTRLELLRTVVETARALPKGKEIFADDIRVVKKWVNRIPRNVITSPEEVIGKVSKLGLGPGREISRYYIREHQLVKRGSLVNILYDDDYLHISTMGVSQENGIADEIIRVRNLASHRIISARVAGNGLVKVEF